MRTRTGIFGALALLLLGGCGGSGGGGAIPSNGNRVTAATTYNITDLGAAAYYYGYYYGNYYYGSYIPIYGLSQGGVIAINAQAQVVTDLTDYASVWQNGGLTQLSASYSSATALNSNGVIVGSAQDPTSYNTLAASWQNGTQKILGALSGGYYSRALGVNAGGDVVGESAGYVNNTYFWHAFLWQNGTMTDIGTLPNGSYSRASGVNATDMVVGWSDFATDNYQTHAFSWQKGQITDLGTLPGGTTSEAFAVNDSGQIVGSSDSPPQGLFAFRALRAVTWQNNTMVDIGTLGGPGAIAFAINNQGQIVGTADTTVIDNDTAPFYGGGGNGGSGGAGGSTNGSGGSSSGGAPATGGVPATGGTPGSSPIGGGAGRALTGTRAAGIRTRGIGDTYIAHAFFYANGSIVDLNRSIPTGSGWELIQANGINEQGQIVGLGILNKRVHAYLLTPK